MTSFNIVFCNRTDCRFIGCERNIKNVPMEYRHKAISLTNFGCEYYQSDKQVNGFDLRGER